MLCAFDPVKYCRAAPQTAAGTTRRSTWIPFVVTTDDLVGPWASTRSTNGMVQKWSMTDPGSSSAATNRSMSPTVSRIRRSDPA